MEDEAIEDERAYKQFTELVNSGDFNDAYRLFKERPKLIGFMAPYEISCAYTGFRSYVGTKNQSYLYYHL